MGALAWAVALLAVAAALYYPLSSLSGISPHPSSSNTPTAPPELPSFTAQEVALHNRSDDLWLIIGTEVFNVTGFYSKHPGGPEILRGAGKDATALFSGHSAVAKSVKKHYLVGRLKRDGDDRPLAINLWEIEARLLNGTLVQFSRWKGKVVLIVNLATACGYTPQYSDLQALHTRFFDRGFIIVGVPSNDFGAQEPGTAEEIQAFADSQGTTFPLLEKTVIARSPLYHFLSASHGIPEWNFFKFIVGRDGQVKRRFPSEVAPLSDPILRVVDYNLRAPQQ